MMGAKELARENAALGGRQSRLCEASDHIEEGLDFDTVLVGVQFRETPRRPGVKRRVTPVNSLG